MKTERRISCNLWESVSFWCHQSPKQVSPLNSAIESSESVATVMDRRTCSILPATKGSSFPS